MPTIDSESTVITLLKNNGVYPDDPQCYQISCYYNTFAGHLVYHLAYSEHDIETALQSPFIALFAPLWHRVGGLTPLGKSFLVEKLKELD